MSGIYVGVSKLLGADTPMLGLFTRRPRKKGAIITEYGGELRTADTIAASPDARSHVMAAKGGGVPSVYDGKATAAHFSLTNLVVNREQKHHYVLPSQPENMSQGERDVFHRRFYESGVGYMANSPNKGMKSNVTLKHVRRDVHGLYPMAVFLVASRDIEEGGEILLNYNWTSPSLLRLIDRA
jgi:hypothetical protein